MHDPDAALEHHRRREPRRADAQRTAGQHPGPRLEFADLVRAELMAGLRTTVVAAACLAAAGAAYADSPAVAPKYPPTRTGDVVDDYFGTKVADPYRWLEDLDSPGTAAWIKAQNEVTFAYLDGLPHRDAIRARLTQLWDFRRTALPVLEAGQLWFEQNSGLERQSPIYRQTGMDGKPTLVIDPNVLSPDGSVAMGQWSPSPDGRLLAYTRAAGGSDVEDIYVRDLATSKDLPGVVLHVKFSGISWTHDNRGFFYSRYKGTETSANFSAASTFHQLWYHAIEAGTRDRLIFDRPDNESDGVFAGLTDDGRWLFTYAASGTSNNRLWVTDLGTPASPDLAATPRVMATEEDAIHVPIGVVNDTVYLYTTYQAPMGRIVAAKVGESDRSRWRTIVPEAKDAITSSPSPVLVGDRIAVVYLADVQSRVRLFGLDGTPRGEVPLPEPGSVASLAGRSDGHELFLRFSSYLRPATVFRHDLAGGALEPLHPPDSAFDASGYETRALFYDSRDGTRIPLFVNLRKGTKLDGSHPTVLYGYGGFNSSEIPWFSPAVAGWLDQGGVYAVANIRGGGEYGEAWHRAGTRERKQNVFDDFIAAAEYLIREKYTTSSRLAINGGSNGGLLVGATMLQRPELFAVALPEVGVLDMMRYHKFSAGPFWADDYGSSDDPAAAKYLLAYSPLHNVKAGTCYPATLITTADRDDRVVPSHSFKFAAALQAAQGCSKPVLIRVEVAGSHGYRPTDRVIAEAADIWAFALANMEPSK
jgi:prolyl oligopeptidase